jgi:hypothetical protein
LRRAAPLLALLVAALARAANAEAEPGSLELTVDRAAFGLQPFWRLHVEGLRVELVLPSTADDAADSKVEGTARLAPTRAGAVARVPTTLLVHEARLAAPGDDAMARLSLSGGLSRSGSEGALALAGSVGPVEAGSSLLEQPWALRLEVREVDAEGLRQLLPPSWRISAASGLLDGDLTLAGRPAKMLAGDLSVDIDQGSVEYLGVHHKAPFHLETKISFGEAPTRISDARVTAASAEFDGRTGTEFRAAFSYSERILDLADAAFTMFGGTLQHQGEVHFAEVPSFDLESHLQGIDTGQLLDNAGPEAEPVLEWKSSLRGRWTGADDWLTTLEGKVRLDLVGGLLPASGVMRSLSTALLSRIPGVEKPGKSHTPARTPLHRAGATFEVGEGSARTDDLRIVTGDYVLNARGHIDADRAIELKGRVALTVAGIGRLLSMAGLRLEGLASVPVVPLRVTGTLQDPRFETDVSSLPLNTWRLVPRTLGAAKGMAEKGAGIVIDAAEGEGRRLRPGHGEAKTDQGAGD